MIFCLATILKAQDYKTGIGLRFGLTNGLTIKHFFSEKTAVNVLATSRWHGLMFTGLFERQHPLFAVEHLKWYYGAGAHYGHWRGYDNHPWFSDNKNYNVLGLDAVVGIEYCLTGSPISVGIDWKPELNLIGYKGLWIAEGAVSIRYMFKGEKINIQ